MFAIFLSTAQILQRHVNDYFQINVKQMIQIVKKDETFKPKRNKSIQEKKNRNS